MDEPSTASGAKVDEASGADEASSGMGALDASTTGGLVISSDAFTGRPVLLESKGGGGVSPDSSTEAFGDAKGRAVGSAVADGAPDGAALDGALDGTIDGPALDGPAEGGTVGLLGGEGCALGACDVGPAVDVGA